MTVTIKNADGATVTVRVAHEETLHIQAGSSATQAPQSADPLIVDLDNNGIKLTDVTQGQGVRFDINGDGRKETVSWVAPEDGMFAFDKNNNGAVDNGTELFGDQNGAANGFKELARYDEDKNGVIDNNDSVFNKLYIWQDKNQDGISNAEELKGLDSYGITQINLNAGAVNRLSGGNVISAIGSYDSSHGKGAIAEAYLNFYG